MIRRSSITGALVLALLAAHGNTVRAQWGYPLGYGGYGWGGWGGQTAQGDIARGMGVYAMGAGYYNQQTAIANSINTDTVMRWNQYVYESQMNANRLHQGKLALDRFRTNTAIDQVQKRLRDNPEPNDIYRGDALNSALDEINNPRVYAKALQGGQVKIGGQLIRNIPFQYAAAAVTMSVHQLVKGDPPRALMAKEFESDRAVLKELGQKIRKQIEDDKNPDPATVKEMLAAINATEAKADKLLEKHTRDRNEVDRYLKALHGLIAMLETPALDLLLSGVENHPEATLADLLTFMNSVNLRFGAATTAVQRQTYDALYSKLVALRDQVGPALATSAPATSAHETAPHDFFSQMSYQDLQKKAPAPPAPATPTPKP
jgi:hypothetical protein